MARVLGLGHVGIYVRDLDRMVAFYQDVMGMRVTKQNRRAGVVFLSADPESVDHEIALMGGRPDPADPHLINQISMRVGSLDDLRAMRKRLVTEGYRIEGVVNHASAIGCYFFDPEGNRNEVYLRIEKDVRQPFRKTIDFGRSPEEIHAAAERLLNDGGPAYRPVR